MSSLSPKSPFLYCSLTLYSSGLQDDNKLTVSLTSTGKPVFILPCSALPEIVLTRMNIRRMDITEFPLIVFDETTLWHDSPVSVASSSFIDCSSLIEQGNVMTSSSPHSFRFSPLERFRQTVSFQPHSQNLLG